MIEDYKSYLEQHYNYSEETKTAFIFVFGDTPEGAGGIVRKGDMPIGHQWGFIFGGMDSRTLAHELGHGLFTLRHTFDKDYGLEAQSTDNLMDYAGGSELIKYQWDILHDPARWGSPFQRDGEGALFNQFFMEENIVSIINKIRRNNILDIVWLDLSSFASSKGVCFNLSFSNFQLPFLEVNVKSNKRNTNVPLTRAPLEVRSANILTSIAEPGNRPTGQYTKIYIPRYYHESGDESSDSISIEMIVQKDYADKLVNYLRGFKLGDPLASMRIVHSTNSPKSGGMFGCARGGSGCNSSSIPNLPKYDNKEKVHDGIDLYAKLDTKVFSMFDGEVQRLENTVPANEEGTLGSFGNRIRIKSIAGQHPHGNNTIYVYYTHLNEVCDEIVLNAKVKKGQFIGKSGKTGNAYNISSGRYHLHITVYKNGIQSSNKVNPLNYFTTKFDSDGNRIE